MILPIRTLFGRSGLYTGGVPAFTNVAVRLANGVRVDYSLVGGPAHQGAGPLESVDDDELAAAIAADWSGVEPAPAPPPPLMLRLGNEHGRLDDELTPEQIAHGRRCGARGVGSWSDTLQEIAKQAAGAAGGFLTPSGTLVQKTATGEMIYRQPKDNPNNLAVAGGLAQLSVNSVGNASGAAIVVGGVVVVGLLAVMMMRRK